MHTYMHTHTHTHTYRHTHIHNMIYSHESCITWVSHVFFYKRPHHPISSEFRRQIYTAIYCRPKSSLSTILEILLCAHLQVPTYMVVCCILSCLFTWGIASVLTRCLDGMPKQVRALSPLPNQYNTSSNFNQT